MTTADGIDRAGWEEALARWPSSDPLCRLAAQLHLLKQLPRTGWLVRGVPGPESVAAHSHGVAVWAMWLAQRKMAGGVEVDLASLLAMAALHDLPEAATGDLMPSQKLALFGPEKADQKVATRSAEARFWAQMGRREVPAQETAQEVARAETDEAFLATEFVAQWEALWAEYRDGHSVEARLLKQADALDCVMQAMLYRHLHGAPLDVFARLIPQAAGDDKALEAYLTALWQETSA